MSLCQTAVSGYIRSIIFSKNKKNTNIQSDIIGLIITFVEDNGNKLLMIHVIADHDAHKDVSIISTSTFEKHTIDFEKDILPKSKSLGFYCNFKMKRSKLPKWLIDQHEPDLCLYKDEAIGFIHAGPLSRVYILNGLRSISRTTTKSMNFVRLPGLIPTAITASCTTIFHNTLLFAFNGTDRFRSLDFAVDTCDELKWSQPQKFHWDKPRSYLSICPIPNKDKFIFLGGRDKDAYFTSDVDIFELNKCKTKEIKSMNYSRLHCGCLFDEILNDQIFVCGGFGGCSFENDPENSSKTMEIYNFDKDVWMLNEKLTNYEHEEPVLFRDKTNPNILMIAGNHSDPNFYERENDGFIEWMDLRDPFPKCKWSLSTDKSLIQMFNIPDEMISNRWRCEYLTSF